MMCAKLYNPEPSTFLGVSWDTLFTTGITIIIFFIGIIFKWWYDSSKENRRLRVFRLYILNYLDGLLEPFGEKISYLGELAKDVKKGRVDKLSHKLDSNLNIEPIDRIDHSELFSIFVRYNNGNLNESLEHYRTITNTVSFLKLSGKYIDNDIDQYVNKFNRDRITLNNNVNQLLRLYEQHLSNDLHNQVNLDEDEFLFNLQDIISSLRKEDDPYELTATRDILILPVIEICKTYLKDDRSISILEKAVNAKVAIKSILKLREIYSNQFTEHKNISQEWLNNLKKSIEYFENCKMKFYFNNKSSTKTM